MQKDDYFKIIVVLLRGLPKASEVKGWDSLEGHRSILQEQRPRAIADRFLQ